MESVYAIQQQINKFTKKYNYCDSRVALKLLAKMKEEDKVIILSDPLVQKTIMGIDDGEVLRAIFRNSPTFFQEIMFNDQHIQDILIAPDKFIKRKSLFQDYNSRNFRFADASIRELETFIHTIKSNQVKEQLIDNKVFQRIVVLCSEKQLRKSFFRTIDEVKLFYNIVNDEEIYNTKTSRKRNILTVFNNVSPHILLTDDYDKVISDINGFMRTKCWNSREYPRVFIDKRTLGLFKKDMLEGLLEFQNIDRELVESLLKDDILANLESNNYDFNEIFAHLLTGRYDCLKAIDALYFKIIMQECQEEVKTNFINFIFNILCDTQELESYEKEELKNMLYLKIANNLITVENYQCLFTGPEYRKTMVYLRFGMISRRMDYLHGITKNQLMYLNVKHINQILKLLHIPNEDEISNIYAYAIKMYLVFGLERTLSILRGEYGKLERPFYDNLSSLNVSGVNLVKEGKKYLPSISDDFINFMFASNKNNHFKEMVSDSSLLLAKNWSYLYNHIDELEEKCHGVLTLKKLNVIFKQLSPTRDIKDVSPDNYKLKENGILNDVCLGNKTSKSNEEVYKNLLDIYDEMKKRYESSIPYISGSSLNGYSYEMMKLNDPIVFTLGYKGNCCIRVNDIAHNHLLHATLCRNGRILLIYNEFHEIVAFVPLKRNGEMLIANSIECLHKKRNDLAIVAFMDAVKSIVSKTSESDEPINLVCIGTEAYARPEGEEFPGNIKTPTIYEKDDPKYQNTDVYHKSLTIIYKNPKLDLTSIKFGDPSVSYQDPREPISSCDFYKADDEEIKRALNVINAVRYANADIDDLENFRSCTRYGIANCIYNEDWYLLTTYNGEVCGDYLRYDKRAEKEFNIAIEEYKNKLENNHQEEIKPLILKYR